jgi:hypothetical protein
VLPIPFRFIEEAALDIFGHERYPINNVPGSDDLTAPSIVDTSTIS